MGGRGRKAVGYKALSIGTTLTLLAWLWPLAAVNLVRAQGQSTPKSLGKRLGLRLRSFVPDARGSLYFEPTLAGGKVRLTALGLPNPQELLPQGSAFVVWAVTSGAAPLRVGELPVDSNGNGGLEFDRPPSFERYSVIVTAETSASATSPLGVMVFATPAGAVSAFYGAVNNKIGKSQLKRINLELSKRSSRRKATHDFFDEVDDALTASGGGRLLELFGDEFAPDAHGIARATSLNKKAYLRVLITNLPQPPLSSAKTYIMWSILPNHHIVYMGNLEKQSTQDVYARVNGITTDYDLFVTAEMRVIVPRPSLQRALSTRSEEADVLSYGAIEGQVLDSAGQPMAGVKVEAVPVGRRVSGLLPTTHTDAEGKFFIDGVTPGANVLVTSKEEEGYASSFFPFFVVEPQSAPQVTVVNQQVTQDVQVHLGPKAAKLRGQVIDSESGKPIQNAEIVYIRADNPNLFYSASPNLPEGGFEHLVPAVGLKVKVSAPGYEDWYYGSDGQQAHDQPLQLQPGATEELNISLQPRKELRRNKASNGRKVSDK